MVTAAMTLVLAGIGFAAWAAATLSLPLIFLASAVLGVAYGITQLTGLTEVTRIAGARSLGTATATYQVLSYTGFALPFLMSLASSHLSLTPPALLLMLLGAAAAAAGWLALAASRTAGTTAGNRQGSGAGRPER
jgi:hypothetical protein